MRDNSMIDQLVKNVRKSFVHVIPTGTRIERHDTPTSWRFIPPPGRKWVVGSVILEFDYSPNADGYIPAWIRNNHDEFRLTP